MRYTRLLSKLIYETRFFSGGLQANLEKLILTSAPELKTSRVSIWYYNHDLSIIECKVLYEYQSGKISYDSESLISKDFPNYTASHQLGRVIDVKNVFSDHRTCEIPSEYFHTHNIISLLDVPIWVQGRLFGLLSFEHSGKERVWNEDEKRFALNLGMLASFCAEADAHVKDEKALEESQDTFKKLVDSLPLAVYLSSGEEQICEYINPKFTELFGYRLEEVPNADAWWPSAYPDKDYRNQISEMWQQRVKRAIDTGSPIEPMETMVTCKNGKQKSIYWRYITLGDKNYTLGVDITDRKHAESVLIESKRKLKEAEELAHLGYWIWDVKTGDVEWSDEVYKIFALDPNAFSPNITSILALSPWPEDHARDKELINTAIESRKPGSYEQKFLRPDKSVGYYYSTFQGRFDEKGDLVSIFGTILDITERRQAEEEIKEHEKTYRALFENMTSGFVLFEVVQNDQGDPVDLIVLAANKIFGETTGLDNQESLGKRLTHLLPGIENDAADWIGTYGKVAITGRALQFEQSSELLGNCYTITAYQPVSKQCAVNFLDITARKHAEDELAKSEERFSLAMKGANDGVWDWDMRSNNVAYSPRWKSMLGYKENELENNYETWERLVHPDDIERAKRKISTYLDGKKSKFEAEFRMQHKDGHWVDILSRGYAVKDELNEQYTRFVGTHVDISERKQSEALLRKSEATIRNKLKAITEPKGDIGELELSDIIDVEILTPIMEDFYHSTGMLGAVLDTSGKVLVTVGWQDICTKFHRCHPESCNNCLESDTMLTRGVAEGEFKAYRCKNNMWDMVTPIMIGGKHVGNVFTGQFFYADETPDLDLFREQARKFGFDENEYLAALEGVPRFTKEELNAGMAFYARLAGIISRLSYNSIQQSRTLFELKQSEKKLRESLEGTISAISKSVEARDPYTAGHEQRVARLACAIADEMGLSKMQIEGIRMGAEIHDIGKIQVPSEILSKPSILSETEFELIKEHAHVGYEILKDIPFPWPVANIAYQHHERMNGSGYPRGLKGKEICLEARIVAVADVVEAINSHRPYRPALGIETALDEIKANRGTFYDSEAVDACLKLFEDNRFSWES